MAERAAVERDDGSPNVPGEHSVWPDWVSATETLNFCADDPLLDWLDLHGAAAGFTRDDEDPRYDVRTDFAAFRLQKAREFEDVLMTYLPRNFVLVRIAGGPRDARDREAARRTWRAMCEGAELIAQGRGSSRPRPAGSPLALPSRRRQVHDPPPSQGRPRGRPSSRTEGAVVD